MRWELVEYTWDPDTGLAELVYERVREDTGEVVTRKETRAQPYAPHHTWWYMRLD